MKSAINGTRNRAPVVLGERVVQSLLPFVLFYRFLCLFLSLKHIFCFDRSSTKASLISMIYTSLTTLDYIGRVINKVMCLVE